MVKNWCENEPVMFGKGIRQALYWAYSMAGISPGKGNPIIAMMMDKKDGYIDEYEPSLINLSGLSDIEVFGEAAGIRGIVEREVTDKQKHYLWAKYCLLYTSDAADE